MTVRIAKQPVNLREKLSELERPIGVKGNELMRAETAQDARDLVSAGRKNLIINGAMQVAQRGTSFSNPSTNQYMIDRWFMGGGASNRVISQQSATVNGIISKTMRFDATGTSGFDIYQAIEDYEYLSNKTVTFSCWYRTNINGVVLRHYATETRGTFANTGDTWTYFAATFTLGTLVSNPRTNNGTSFGFWTAGGGVTNGSFFEVTQVQLEVGKNATEFEHRSYGEELALCQRYYGKIRLANQEWIYNEGNISTNKWHWANVPFSMRANPSVDMTDITTGGSIGGLTGTISSLTPQSPGDTPGRISSRLVMSANGGTARYMYHCDAWNSDYIALNAEL